MNNKYVVAYMSFFDNNLKQIIVRANTDVDAAIHVLMLEGWEFVNDGATMQQLQEECFNSDAVINVLEIVDV
jgi:hypothetical protein